MATVAELERIFSSASPALPNRRYFRQIVHFPGGEQLFYKSASSKERIDREVLGYAVASVTGALVPACYRVSDTLIVLEVVAGEHLWEDKQAPLRRQLRLTREGQRLALTDRLIRNNDRHEMNWKCVDGKPVGFDFGASFYTHNEDGTRSFFGAALNMKQFNAPARRKVDAGLARLAGDFAALGHRDWYEMVMGHWEEFLRIPVTRDKRGRFAKVRK